MSFIDSYKRLDKLCSEMYENGVSSYIEEMESTFDGSRYVARWDADLKQLKHCRAVRNKIAHEIGCTEENTCEPDDELWVKDLYSRIIAVQDPLTLYGKAKNKNTKRPNSVQHQTAQTHSKPYTAPQNNKRPSNPSGCLMCVAVMTIIVVFVIVGCM